MSVIDLNSLAVKTTLPVGTLSYGMAMTPDGRLAFVANAGSNNVSVKFDVKLESVEKADPKMNKTKIIESHGHAPQHYPGSEEWDEG